MPLFYITRDIERAVGLLGVIDGYYIITYSSPLAEALRHKFGKQIILINQETRNKKQETKSSGRSTLALIRSKYVREKFHELSDTERPNILVFKNSYQIEEECKRLNWNLLNPSTELSGKIENKISQYEWLEVGKRARHLIVETPSSVIGEVSQFYYKDLVSLFGVKFIVQFNRAHTGVGTRLVETKEQWEELVIKFPRREIKIAMYIKGGVYTINACVIRNGVMCGRTSKQITGQQGLTSNLFATVGNDWGSVNKDIHENILKIAMGIGQQMIKDGWKGLFGIDVIIPTDDNTHPGYLIEINARQPASACLESQLQNEKKEISIMEQHVNALCGNAPQPPHILRERDMGSQIFFRNTENHPVSLKNEFLPARYKVSKVSEEGLEFIENATSITETQKGEIFAFSVSQAEKVKPGGELLRIQSKQGIVDTFGKNYQDVMSSIRKQMYIEI